VTYFAALGMHPMPYADFHAEHRQAGGPVTAGNPYWVGEAGPEPFIPGTSGTIISRDSLGSITVGEIHIHESETPQATARAVREELLRLGRGMIGVGLG
jgi:hypothetical protein